MAWLAKMASVSSGITGKAVEAVADGAFSLLESEVSRYLSIEEELDRLKRTSHRINSLLIDAEQRRYIQDHSVRLWLSHLKSVSFDTDDLLDAYQTALRLYRRHHAALAPDLPRKRKWFHFQLLPSLSPQWGPLQRRRFADQIARINTRLHDINEARKTLRLRGQDGATKKPHHHGQGPPNLPPGPLHDRSTVIGRQHDQDEIVHLLTSDLNITLPVLPICGAAGIGKTTLARLVYNDHRIDHYFQLKAWVSLTDLGSDVKNATKDIYEKFTGQPCRLQAYEPLQNNLRNFLQSHQNDKFLLVIDNLLEYNFNFWENLQAPLLTGKEGSKILITTRNEQACRTMHALSRPSLVGLGHNECWQLLESHALPQVIHSAHRDRLATLGKEIAKRCDGSPLAAKTLGTLLNGAREEEWSDVLSEMRALKDDKNGVLAMLQISYHHLPYHLKQCFAYCAIFPNGYKFEREQVIRYWMAEGLIQPVSRRRPEAVGMKYFDELLWRSFFEKIPVCDKNRVERYKMPSLMYDLARLVSVYEFRDLESHFVTSQPESGHHDQVRYASLLHQDSIQAVKLECIELYPNLRTLKVCDDLGDRIVPLNTIKAQLFRKCANLRVLDLSNSTLKCVPDSIAELIHLRYLGLSNTEIITLPEKIGELFNLQTLDLKGCPRLEGLPHSIRKLINLRHLDLHLDWEEITDSTDLVISPGIGELEQIQTLSRFSVSCNAKTQDCNIVELKDINLKGELCVLNIERVPVQKPEVALNANLEGKQYIENLMLRWNASAHSDHVQWQLSESVMHHLRPNNRLRKLWLINYPGTSFPDWIGDASFLSLETIRISNCNNFSFLKLLGQLPQLKNLQIDNIPASSMDAFLGFLSLKNLVLSNLPFLERLCLENEIPKLEKVSVSNCPYLKEVVIHQKMQNKIERKNCPNLPVTLHIPPDL